MAKQAIQLTKESKRKLQALANAGELDLRPPLKTIGVSYRKEVKAIFERQQPRGEGLRWEPLSEEYAERKARQFPGAPILVRTGALKNSATKLGAEGNISKVGKTSGEFGTSLKYAGYHDDGTRKMPRRNFSEPSDRRFDIWKGILERDIRMKLESKGIKVTGSILT